MCKKCNILVEVSKWIKQNHMCKKCYMRENKIEKYMINEFHGMIHDWSYWSRHTLNSEGDVRNYFRGMWE